MYQYVLRVVLDSRENKKRTRADAARAWCIHPRCFILCILYMYAYRYKYILSE